MVEGMSVPGSENVSREMDNRAGRVATEIYREILGGKIYTFTFIVCVAGKECH